MKLDFYVNYKGNCRQAFAFYEQCLSGKVTSIQTFGEMQNAPLPPGAHKDDVIHSRMDIGGAVLMGADIPNAEPMRSAYLTLVFDNTEEAETKYAQLSESGEIFMPLKQTDFADRFAMFRDRFGTNWMILCQNNKG